MHQVRDIQPPMKTPASIRNHPIHPMLVTVPIGLWLFALACDLIGLSSVHADLWYVVSLYAMIGGILGALAAAVPGLVDLVSLRERAHRRVALVHMGLNLLIVVLYVVNAWLRIVEPTRTVPHLALSLASIALRGVSGWLGGSLVHVHGVGVLGVNERSGQGRR